MAFGNKNLVVLLTAYSRLPRTLRDEFALVVAGPTLQRPDQLAEMTSRLNIRDRVIFFSKPIPHEELCWFYNAAALFVLPSQYEMFCNMLLEAMRCRCPVLASGLAANVEVGADAIAYYSLINDPDDLAAALQRFLESDGARTDLALRGHARGATFTWRRHASELVSLYSEVFAP
jgi:glycosyltransferase involved in cell wall biosynthesis